MQMSSRPAPARPPMQPPSGVRQIKRQPHEMIEPVTPTEDLFVLAHLGIPRVDAAAWQLTIDGLVERPVRLSLQELMQRPRTTVEAAHNCCGSPLEPTVPTRRVANLRWTGTDLGVLLDQCGVDSRATFIWSHGLDGGEFAGGPVDWFVKDLPLSRLALDGVLLAYELNGAPIPAEHGFPVRLVVPGFYGTNSVKWLWRLHLADRRSDGLFAAKLYNDETSAEDRAAGAPARRPVWGVAPGAIIVAPSPEVVLDVDQPVEISGWAWSFRGIAAVEISVDGNASFQRARLEKRRSWAWQRFTLGWRPQSRGDVQISARAVEALGAAQPVTGARNAMHSVRVVVR